MVETETTEAPTGIEVSGRLGSATGLEDGPALAGAAEELGVVDEDDEATAVVDRDEDDTTLLSNPSTRPSRMTFSCAISCPSLILL